MALRGFYMTKWVYCQIDPTKVLTINEQRRLLDEALPMLDDGDVLIEEKKAELVDVEPNTEEE
jgi:hypothetical protein